MANIKTYRVNGPLTYDQVDDNFDNLNADKIERTVDVNDTRDGVNIKQSGTGNALVVNTDTVVVKGNKIGVGTLNPEYSFQIEKTDAQKIPVGTTAQRPTNTEGLIRFNKDTGQPEFSDGKKFKNFDNTNLNIEKISCGGYNGIQILGEGEVYHTSGTNGQWGVYGNGKTNNFIYQYGLDEFDRVIIPDDSKVIDSNQFGYNSYALCENGNLYTWGYNQFGQCGLGYTGVVVTPTLASTNVVKVFTDPSNAGFSVNECRLIIQKTDGWLYGCGYNGYGQLGISNTTATIPTLTQLTAFGRNPVGVWNLGSTYGCLFVQTSDRKLLASGYNGYGQLGDGSATSKSTPVDVTAGWLNGNTGWIIKYMGGGFGYYSTAANSYCTTLLHAENTAGTQSLVKTCGANNNNQCGTGNTTQQQTPFTLTFPDKVKVCKYFGVLSGMVLLENGNLYAWGWNGYGRSGSGSTANLVSPTLVQTDVDYFPMENWNAHTYGWYATNFIIKKDGYLYGCGWNDHGQVGVGHASAIYSFTRVLIPTGPENKIKMMGMYNSTGTGAIVVAVREDNEIFGWGYNGQYGVYNNSNGTNVYAPKIFKIKRT